MSVSRNDLNQLVTRAELSSLEQHICTRIDQLHELVKSISLRLFVQGSSSSADRKKEFYSPAEFAALTGQSKNTVIRRCQDGTYKSTQPGGKGTLIMIPGSEVDRLTSNAEELI